MSDEELKGRIAHMQELSRRLQAQTRAVVDEDYIAKTAIDHWAKDGSDYFICQNPAWRHLEEARQHFFLLGLRENLSGYRCGRWNGYVRFPKLPGILPGYGGIYTYVPVHGGLTFFQEWADGSVTYGFDCGHAFSSEAPVEDLGWMHLETESMARSIRIAARFEPYYLRANDDEMKKARVLDRMGGFLPVDPSGNLGILLNLIRGEL